MPILKAQFQSPLLDGLVKNLNKNDFKYLSQGFDNNVKDLVKQKGFYPYEYVSNFEKFKEQLPNKENFYTSLSKIVIKIMNMFLIFRIYLK